MRILLPFVWHLALGTFEYLKVQELRPEAFHDSSNKHLASIAKTQNKAFFAFYRQSQSKYAENNVVNIH